MSLNANPPVSVWNKPLTLDVKTFAKALANVAKHGVLGNFESLADDGLEALEALGLQGNQPETLLFLLVQQALKRALADLLTDSETALPANLDEQDGSLIAGLQSAISEISISRNFFEHPQNLPLLGTVQAALGTWLTGCGIEAPAAQALAARLPAYFTFALHKEWGKHGDRYAPVKASLDTPFTKATEREQAWRAYHAYLQKHIEEGAFGEAFGLRQIYIPLNAYREEKHDGSLDRDISHQPKRRTVFGLAEELVAWLSQAKKDDALRVLSGGPGSGKSSFAKMFAAQLAAKGVYKVLFVPLHLIDATGDFAEAVGRFLRNQGFFNFNPLHADAKECNVLLILDGLDELASQGQAAAQTARDFVAAVQKFVYQRNYNALNLRVLFSGREVAVQETRSELRNEQQILHLLPYYLTEEERRQADWEDPDERLSYDQRDDWWRIYGQLTGKSFTGLPEAFKRKDMEEISAQPLLNYLLAISYCQGGLDLSQDITLNKIYAHLVRAVYERGYEGRRHAGISHMSEDDFFLMLEEVALAAWHGDGRSTTVKEIEAHCREAGYEKQLTAFREGAERGITRLLAAFFFRQHGERPRGDPTFVFTHKSFGEYLTARRLVRAMADIVEERERREQKGGGKGYSEADALERWVRLCGPTVVSRYLHRFWLAEIALRPVEEIKTWQQQFVHLFSYLLRHGSPMERVQGLSFQQALNQARNAEEALLAAMNACARHTGMLSEIIHPEPTTFGAWFKRIQGQRTGGENVLAYDCLSWLNLKRCQLDMLDLFAANLTYSDLVEVQATLVILRCTNLMGVDLCGAYHYGADLSGTMLSGADLSGADLRGADLSHANLINAIYTQDQINQARSIEGAIFNDPG